MKFFDQIKTGGFADPSIVQGAVLFAIFSAFLAWLVGSALRLSDKNCTLNGTAQICPNFKYHVRLHFCLHVEGE